MRALRLRCSAKKHHTRTLLAQRFGQRVLAALTQAGGKAKSVIAGEINAGDRFLKRCWSNSSHIDIALHIAKAIGALRHLHGLVLFKGVEAFQQFPGFRNVGTLA